MNNEHAPFDVVIDGDRTVLRLIGTKVERAVVEEDDARHLMEALVAGWDIDIAYAVFKGPIDTSTLSGRLERVGGGGRHIVAWD